jgi:alkanesulfonate monooxygenase SsuD/methylene tetrahydromethanopterin reductase-like flavin-dependent oxidoreductase (luciferase family)
LIGTVDEVVDQLEKRRERYGISFVIVPGDVVEAFAPVVERLDGVL